MQIQTRTQAITVTAAYVALAVTVSLLLIFGLFEAANLPLGEHPKLMLILGAVLTAAITPPTWWSARQQYRHAVTHRQHRLTSELDPLTGLLNRPALAQQCNELLQQVPRSKPYTLLLLDLDFFPEFCETYGNLEADRVLQHFAAHLAGRVRDNDFFCRLDRESFALLLVGSNLSQATKLADRMVSAVAQRPFSNDKSILEFTASVGYADSTHANNYEMLSANAASALLQAKRQGHNRAVAFSPPTASVATTAENIDGQTSAI